MAEQPSSSSSSNPSPGPSSSSNPAPAPSSNPAPAPSSSSTPRTITIIGPNPERYSRQSKGKSKLTYDFNFLLQPSTILRHSIAALCNQQFNPASMGLLEVDETGLSITVSNATQSEPGCVPESIHGFLRLQKKFFNFFQCSVPIVKMIDLQQVLVSLATGNDSWLLAVFSECGSNAVSFEFEPDGSGRAPERISVVDLTDVWGDYPRFPDTVYECPAYLPTALLQPVITEILARDPDSRPDFVTLQLHPATVSISIGGIDVQSDSYQPEEVWLNWPFWETLLRAVQTSEECTVYMLTEPDLSLMLLFQLSQHYERISFRRGSYTCKEKTSCLAFFRALVT